MGVKHVVVLVVKMDVPSVDYSSSRFEKIKEAVNACLKEVGFKQKEVPVVPISGVAGDNLTVKSATMGWYGGETVVASLDACGPINRHGDKPLRLLVLKVHDVFGTGIVIFGRVETGSIRTGTKVLFAPSGNIAEVQSIQLAGEKTSEAKAGDVVSVCVGDELVAGSDIRPGMVVSSSSSDPASDTNYFIAQVIVLDHPGTIRAGYCLLVAIGAAQAPCEFEALLAKMDRKIGKEVEKNLEGVKANDVIIVRLWLCVPLVVEAFSIYFLFGRFVVWDHGRMVVVGVVKEVNKRSV